MKRFLTPILSFVLLGTLSAFAEIPNHHIFYRIDKRAPLTKIEIVFLGAGTGVDSPSQIGLAATVEKLIWETAKKQGHIDQLEALGIRLNVTTYTEYQTISIYGLSENSGKAIEIVRDLIYNLAFSEYDLKYVKSQLTANYKDEIKRATYTLMKNLALSQTLGIMKRRSLKTLNDLSLDDVRQYADQLLKTNVVFFKVISDRDSTAIANALRPLTEERKMHGQAGGFVHSFNLPSTDTKVGPTAFIFENYSHLKNVFCRWMIPCGHTGEENYIPNMITNTLGRSPNSRLLYKYFREELKLVYGISCQYLSEKNARYLDIYADPQLDNSEELITKMADFIQNLPDNPRFWKTLKEYRETDDISFVHDRTPQQRLNREVSRAIYKSPRRKGGSDAVTDDEVRTFLEKYFVPQNMIMIFLGPRDHIIEILNTHLPEVDIRVHNVKELIE
ncbi:MAG: insulinase family protein [Gemmatimonadetes bacterium]|nr:insulinase family protein [Gemmatimonadota bacterium]